jgi:hypothetical protein
VKRIAKVAAVCTGIIAVFALFFFVPIVPMTVVTWELYTQHGGCTGEIAIPPQTSNIYASVSYFVSHSGVVYVPAGGSRGRGSHQVVFAVSAG